MKKKGSFLSCIIALITVITMLPVSATTGVSEQTSNGYISSGLVSWYDGTKNKLAGHDATSTVWEDLISDNDITVVNDATSGFKQNGYYLKDNVCVLPDGVTNLLKGNSFTMEFLLGEVVTNTRWLSIIGTTTTDEQMALFLDSKYSNRLALKAKGIDEDGGTRPIVAAALPLLQNSLVTVTYNTADGAAVIYIDGKEQARSSDVKGAAITGDTCQALLGYSVTERVGQERTYRSIRFYNRALSADEVKANAVADGVAITHPGHISVAQPVTNIVGDIAVTREINSAEELATMMATEKLPAAAIYRINSELDVLDNDGKGFVSLWKAIEMTEFKVLPIVVPADLDSVNALTVYLKEIEFYDLCVLTDNKEWLKTARTVVPSLRGALDLTEEYKNKTELTREDLINIRKAVNTYYASVALLPAAAVTKDNVQQLYYMQVNTYLKLSDTPTVTEKYNALLSGALGAVTDDTAGLLDIACNSLSKNTMTRTPLNSGHRGALQLAPQNTIESYLLAYEKGSNCIEMDAKITTDGKVFMFHDTYTKTLTGVDLKADDCTWAQLSGLTLTAVGEYTNCKIPLMDDVLKALKDKDCMLLIELKSSNEAIVEAAKKIIEDNGMYDRVILTTTFASIREVYPEMSNLLVVADNQWSAPPTDADMVNIMNYVGEFNAAYGMHANDANASSIRAGLIRGITIHPWKNGETGLAFESGYSGLIINNPEDYGGCIEHFKLSDITEDINVGDKVELSMEYTTYAHKNKTTKSVAVDVIDGEGLISVDGNTIIANGSGKVTLIAKYSYSRDNALISLCTQPFTLVIGEATDTDTSQKGDGSSDEDSTDSSEISPGDESETQISQDDPGDTIIPKGVIIAIASIGGITVLGGVVFIILKKKKIF